MRVIILEDEPIALEKLTLLLNRIDSSIEVVGSAKSVKDALVLIEANDHIDLGFFDIQLSDGLSFSVLERLELKFPVVFTTAYNEYAIQAFQHHSIGYLLKPLQKSDLEQVLLKYRDYWKPNNNSDLLKVLRQFGEKKYKDRFTLKVGDRIKLIEKSEIACFYSRFKATFILTRAGKSYDIEHSLDALNELINPEEFFRVNRKHIVQIDAIDTIINYSNSRLKVVLSASLDEDVIVAREKVKEFKKWLEGDN
ncbi:MAG: DNA-binding LytR/AlgR family response regulator [Crocinitomicaceae bacterium]|jgi:DNA-binding LytR/AlgR family response regulator